MKKPKRKWWKCVDCQAIEDERFVGVCFKAKEEGFVDMELWSKWQREGWPQNAQLHTWRYFGEGSTLEEAEADGLLNAVNKVGRRAPLV